MDGSPGVSQVFITSHFPLPPDTHTQTHTHIHTSHTHTPHFHFSLGWAVRLEYQTPSFPKWDLLRFTSSIKTFQWSQDSVLSRWKIAPVPERPPQKTEAVLGRSTGCRDNENCELFLGFFIFFPLPPFFTELLDIILFPDGLRCNQWHTHL